MNPPLSDGHNGPGGTLNPNGSGIAEVVLAELTYIDPSGLSVLAVEKHRADTSGLALRISSPMAFVRQLLDSTGLSDSSTSLRRATG